MSPPFLQALPVSLLVGWGEEREPSSDEVIARLEQVAGPVHAGPDDPARDEGMLWARPLRVGAHAQEIGVWAQPGITFSEGALRGRPAGKLARWGVGLQSFVKPDDDPYQWFGDFLRMIREAFNELVYVADPYSGAIWGAEDVDGILSGPVLPDGVLWSVQTIRIAGPGARPAAWLRTAGLARFGRPELEMLEVPPHLTGSAMLLLSELAERFVHEPLPAPGVRIAVGGESSDHLMGVVVRPWEEIVRFLPPDRPGQLQHRTIYVGPDIVAVSAVVCSIDSYDTCEPANMCPIDILEAIWEGKISLLQSDIVIRRRAALARFGWPELAMAFQRWQREAREDVKKHVRFFVVTTVPAPGAEPDGAESVTIEIESVDGDTASGRLVHDAHWNRSMRRGDSMTISCATISDWYLETPTRRVGAQHRPAVQSTIEVLLAHQ